MGIAGLRRYACYGGGGTSWLGQPLIEQHSAGASYYHYIEAVKEMPDSLPSFPPVPEGYDRWAYRGKGASGLKRYAYFCYEVGQLDWRVQVNTDLPSNGVPSYHYIEAVKDEPQEVTTISEPDMVNSPPHYQGDGIECIDAIRAALTPEEFRGYCKGNGLKYIWRELNKGGDQDIAKAAWYMNQINQKKP